MPRYRICFQKTGPAAYLSHLDLLRVMERALRRAGLPLAYSEGFNPHPRLAFAAPLPVGIGGEEELADIELREEIQPQTLPEDVNRRLPAGLAVRRAWRVADSGPSLMAQVRKASYRLAGPLDRPLSGADLEAVLERTLARDSILVTREVKGKTRTLDIRPGILGLEGDSRDGAVELRLALAIGVRPLDVLGALVEAGLPADPFGLAPVRTAVYGTGPLL